MAYYTNAKTGKTTFVGETNKEFSSRLRIKRIASQGYSKSEKRSLQEQGLSEIDIKQNEENAKLFITQPVEKQQEILSKGFDRYNQEQYLAQQTTGFVFQETPDKQTGVGVYDIKKQQTRKANLYEELFYKSEIDKQYLNNFNQSKEKFKSGNEDFNKYLFSKKDENLYFTTTEKGNSKDFLSVSTKPFIFEDITPKETKKEKQKSSFIIQREKENKELLEFQAKNREKLQPYVDKLKEKVYSLTDKDYNNYVKQIEASKQRQENFFKNNQGIKNINEFSKTITLSSTDTIRSKTAFNLFATTPVVSVPSLIASGENVFLTLKGLAYRETAPQVKGELQRAISPALQVYKQPETYTTAIIFGGLTTGNVLANKYGTPPPKSSGYKISYDSIKVSNIFTDKTGSIKGKSPFSKANLRKRTQYQNAGLNTIQKQTGGGIKFSNKERSHLYSEAQNQLKNLNQQQPQKVIKGNPSKITTFKGKDTIFLKQGKTIVGKIKVQQSPKEATFIGIKQDTNINLASKNNQVLVGIIKTKKNKIISQKAEVIQLNKPNQKVLNQYKTETNKINKVNQQQEFVSTQQQQPQSLIERSLSRSGGREKVKAQLLERLRLKKQQLDAQRTQQATQKYEVMTTNQQATGKEILIYQTQEYKPNINLKTYSNQEIIKPINENIFIKETNKITIPKTETKIINKYKSDNTLRPQTILYNQKTFIKNDIKSDKSLKQSEAQALSFKPIQDIKSDKALKQSEAQALSFKPIQDIKSVNKEKQKSRPQTILINSVNINKPIYKPQEEIKQQPKKRPQTIIGKPKIIKEIPPIFSIPKFSRQNNVKNDLGFDVFIKRKGIFEKATSKPLSKSQALGFGAFQVSQEASATFKLKASNSPVSTGSRSFGLTSFYNDFYKSRKETNTFIQKANKRIGTFGEKREITFKGISARKNKNVFGGFRK